MATSSDVRTAPLRFHACCGRNVRLSSDCQQARRINTNFFSRGLVFTSRPIAYNEKVSVKLLELSDSLGAFLYVGFTGKDPQKYRNVAYSELTNRPGYWAWFFPKNLCNRNSVLFFYYTLDGSVHYGVDGVEKGVFRECIRVRVGENKVWALIDIFGNCEAIKMIESQMVLLPEPNQDSGLRFQGKTKFLPLILHQAHSKCISIGLSGNLAHRAEAKFNQGYMFTHRPLEVNEKVVLQVLPRNVVAPTCYLTLGLTCCDPGLLLTDHLPINAHGLVDRAEYWVVLHDFSKSLSAGDEVNFAVEESGEVRVELNGFKLIKSVHVDQTQQLWLFVNLYSGTLPVQLWSVQLQSTDFGQSDRQDKECMVCYENAIDTVLYRCGHMCMCFDCAEQQWQGKGHGHCPICRALIRDVIKINND